MKKILVLFCILSTVFYSCESDSNDDDEIVLIGSWRVVAKGVQDLPLPLYYSNVEDSGFRKVFDPDGTVSYYSNYTDLDTVYDYSLEEGFLYLDAEVDYHLVIDGRSFGFMSLTDTTFETIQPFGDDSFSFIKYKRP